MQVTPVAEDYHDTRGADPDRWFKFVTPAAAPAWPDGKITATQPYFVAVQIRDDTKNPLTLIYDCQRDGSPGLGCEGLSFTKDDGRQEEAVLFRQRIGGKREPGPTRYPKTLCDDSTSSLACYIFELADRDLASCGSDLKSNRNHARLKGLHSVQEFHHPLSDSKFTDINTHGGEDVLPGSYPGGGAWAADYDRAASTVALAPLYDSSSIHHVELAELAASSITTTNYDDRTVPARSFEMATELQRHLHGREPVSTRVDKGSWQTAGEPFDEHIDRATEILSATARELGADYCVVSEANPQ